MWEDSLEGDSLGLLQSLINGSVPNHSFVIEIWIEKCNNDNINNMSSPKPAGICSNGFNHSIYIQAHFGNTWNCYSKLTARILIVPNIMFKEYALYMYAHACLCSPYTLARSLRSRMCICTHKLFLISDVCVSATKFVIDKFHPNHSYILWSDYYWNDGH